MTVAILWAVCLGHGPAAAQVEGDACAQASVEALDARLNGWLAHGERDVGGVVSQLYECLLSKPAARTDRGSALLRRHRAQAALVAPDTVDDVSAWWRAQDPLPATPRNERLAAHLERVAHARRHFADESTRTGLDARGETYVRYGEPARRRSIPFDDADFVREVLRPGVPVTWREFRANEVWLYDDLGPNAYFLFVRPPGESFRLGTADELVPEVLRRAQGQTPRGLNVAYSAVAALRYIYGELARFHIDYSPRFQEVESYAVTQEVEAFRDRTRGGALPGSYSTVVGMAGTQGRRITVNPSMGLAPPTRFLRRTLLLSARHDREAAARREATLPSAHFDAHEALAGAPLPVVARHARFLDPDGTTRTEVYWRLQPGTAPPPDGEHGYRVDVSAVRLSPDHERRHVARETHAVPPDGLLAQVGGPVRRITLPGADGSYRVAVQWELRPATTPSDAPRRAFAVWRAGPVEALSADPALLEMSDLVPVVAADEDDMLRMLTSSEGVAPHLDTAWHPAAPLALCFEVYHLARDADGSGRYALSYTVDFETRRGARAPDRASSATAVYTAGSATVQECVALDVEVPSDARALHVNVQVEDRVQDRRVQRALRLDLLDRGAR